MKNLKEQWPMLAFVMCLLLLISAIQFFPVKQEAVSHIPIIESIDTDQLEASIAKILIKPAKGELILQNYPFPLLDPPVSIAEGFESYDGNLGDKPGALHYAIDYVQKSESEGTFQPFPVFSTHDGIAFQGVGKTWGKFVVVRLRDNTNQGYNTLYSHLTNIPKSIPFMTADIDNSKGVPIKAGIYIGDAGTTGDTKGVPQLHFEMHSVDIKNRTTARIDPYGVYARYSSGFYPKVGSSLSGLPHYWSSDEPAFPVW